MADKKAKGCSGCLVSLVGLVAIGWVVSRLPRPNTSKTSNSSNSQQVSSSLAVAKAKQAPKQETRQERIQKQFGRSGAHLMLMYTVKNSLGDPGSFEHVSTGYRELGPERLLVRMTYRARNSYNARVVEVVDAVVDLDGNILKLDQVH